MEYIKFNLNAYVLITITDYGWNQLVKKYDSDYMENIINSRKVVIEGKDWYKFQAHQLITIFGTMLFMYSPSPIEINILIPDNQLLKT